MARAPQLGTPWPRGNNRILVRGIHSRCRFNEANRRKNSLRRAGWRWGPHRHLHRAQCLHAASAAGRKDRPMTNQIDALNAMAVLVADRNYQALDQLVIEHLMGK